MPDSTDILRIVKVGETLTGAVSFEDLLKDSAVLTGTPTVVEDGSSDLTISSKGLNTVAITMFGESVAISNAVVFSFSGQLVDKVYRIKVTVSNDASPAQTWVRVRRFCAEDV